MINYYIIEGNHLEDYCLKGMIVNGRNTNLNEDMIFIMKLIEQFVIKYAYLFAFHTSRTK